MKKRTVLQWRADEDDRALASRLAAYYGVNVSDLFRFALSYIDAQKPALAMTITLPGKKPAVKGRKTPPRNGAEGAP